MLIINISDIVPPPIGTAAIRMVAIRETSTILAINDTPIIWVLNKDTKNIILNTLPIIEPSL